MKKTTVLMAIAMSILFFTACKKETALQDQTALQASSSDDLTAGSGGYVFTLNNQRNNRVIVFRRGMDGMLKYISSYTTGGMGTSAGLGNQGALALSKEKMLLFAVNAGSNTISSLKLSIHGLQLMNSVNSGGETPISITQYGDLVYVLNAGSGNNITGFKLDKDGYLKMLKNSTRPLTDPAAGGAQVSFVQDGKVLVVTEKATNKIVTFTVEADGTPGTMHELTAANATPFGFGEDWNHIIYVSEAAGGAPKGSTLSSYAIGADGSIQLLTGPVSANQTAACWVVLTRDGKYAYTTNTGSNNVSSFMISGWGDVMVQKKKAAEAGMGPIDAAISRESEFLYVLNGASHNISVYSINGNGKLDAMQTLDGLPAGTTGMIAE